jgi:hypothetical protein
MGEWRYSSNFLNLGNRWKRVVSFMTLPLYSRGTIPGTHWKGACVGFRADGDAVEKRKIPTPCRKSKSNFSAIQHRYPVVLSANHEYKF